LDKEMICNCQLEDGTCEDVKEDNERNGKCSIRVQFGCRNENKNICCHFCEIEDCKIRCVKIEPIRFLNHKYQVIDGSRVRISDFPLCGGAKYEPSENSILLFVLPSHFDGEKVTIKYKEKTIYIPIEELFSEVIEHEFLHMLLFHFINRITSGCLNRIDAELRAGFYDKFLFR
jgi:hypothetical protein